MSGYRTIVADVARVIEGPGLPVDRADSAVSMVLDRVRQEIEAVKFPVGAKHPHPSHGGRLSCQKACLAALESLEDETVG